MKFAGTILKTVIPAVAVGAGAYGLGRQQGFDSYKAPGIVDHLAAKIQSARPDLTLNQAYYEATNAYDQAVGNGQEYTDAFMRSIDADSLDTWEQIELNPRAHYGYNLVQRTDAPAVPTGMIYREGGDWIAGTPWADNRSFTVG